MEFKNFNDKAKIPVLGIGTGMGDWTIRDISSDKKCIEALKTAIKFGITHIDTAELYGDGHAEELIGKAIKGINRKKLFITTKVWKTHLKYNDVISAAKNSLKRLGVKYIDLYLIHVPDPETPLVETLWAMDFLVENKIVRFIGVSNFSIKLLRKAQSYTKNKIVANQVEYNLIKRKSEDGLLEYCQKNNTILIAYQPVAGGKLAMPGFKVLDKLCEKYNKTQAQIAINWLISKPNVITIPKTSNITHIKENLGAIGWRLSKEDTKKLDKYFGKFWFFSNLLVKPVKIIKEITHNILSIKQKKKIKWAYDKIRDMIARLEKFFFNVVLFL